MAKLSRTQKYAQLRDSISNDAETVISTNELNTYEDKLKAFESQVFNIQNDSDILPKPSFDTPIKEEDSIKKQSENLDSFGLNNNSDDLSIHVIENPAIDETVAEEPVEEEKPIEVSEGEELVAEDVISQVEEVKDNSEEYLEPIVLDTRDAVDSFVNNYLNDTLKEVNDYNHQEGLQTIDEIPSKIINEVRGHIEEVQAPSYEDTLYKEPYDVEIENNPDEVVEEKPVEEAEFIEVDQPAVEDKKEETLEDIIDDDNDNVFEDLKPISIVSDDNFSTDLDKEFDDTVTLEISKLFDSINEETIEMPSIVEDVEPVAITPKIEEKLEETERAEENVNIVLEQYKNDMDEATKIMDSIAMAESTVSAASEDLEASKEVIEDAGEKAQDIINNTIDSIESNNVFEEAEIIENIDNNNYEEKINEINDMVESVNNEPSFIKSLETESIEDNPTIEEVAKEEPVIEEKPIVEEAIEDRPVIEETVEEPKLDDVTKVVEKLPEVEAVVDDGLEIKNLSDMDEKEFTQTLSDTIPFVVAQDDDDDDEEDEAPNKLLNVILIILIIVLVAVLGLIVYYILLANGILQ